MSILKKAVLAPLALALSLAVAVPYAVFADNTSEGTPQESSAIVVAPTLINGEVDPIITPFASSKPFSINFAGDRTADYDVFTTSSAMPWAKVYAYNTGTGNMRVTITKDSPSGAVVGALTLTPGQQDSIKGMMPTPGTYYVSFVSTSAFLKGSASGRIASTYEELDV